MAGYQELEKDIDIDVASLFSQIWKKKILILLLSLIAGAAIFFVMSGINPRYQTTAQILIEPTESVFTKISGENAEALGRQFDKAAVQSQVQVIHSDEIALATIKQLNLIDAPEFRSEAGGSLVSNLLMLVGLKSDPLKISPEERMLNTFKERLKVYSIEESRVIEIVFWAEDRQLAKEITNTIASAYLELQKRSKLETDSNATQFLEPEIEALRQKVEAAESKVAEFRANSDILIGNNNALLATQQLSEVSSELSRVRAQHSAARAKVESVRATLDSGASLDVIPEVAASPLIQRLRERQVQLRAQISELSTSLLQSHPRLKALKSQVADFENQIRREARSILVSLENNVDLAAKQEVALTDELTRLKAESARAGEAEVKLRALERDAVSERELLQAYTKRYREAAGRQNSKYQPVNARIISEAQLPTESFFPKTIPFTIAGAILTAVLTMVAILAGSLLSGSAIKTVNNAQKKREIADREIADDEVVTHQLEVEGEKRLASQIERSPDNHQLTQPIAATPRASTQQITPPPMQVDAFDSAETFSVPMAVAGIASMQKARIAVVSAQETGSAIAMLVARQLTESGHTAALVDLSGTGASSKIMLGAERSLGIRDLMAGSVQLDQVLANDSNSNAAVIGVGNGEFSDVEMALGRLKLALDALENAYDFLIVDCGMSDLEGVTNVTDNQSVILVAGGDHEASAMVGALQSAGYLETIAIEASAQEQAVFANFAA